MTVAEFEPEQAAAPRRRTRQAPKPPQASATTLGLAVSDLTDAQKRELKIKGGVKVDGVDGAAQRAGMREGDIVLSLDNTEITGAKQFEALVGKLDKAKPVTLAGSPRRQRQLRDRSARAALGDSPIGSRWFSAWRECEVRHSRP